MGVAAPRAAREPDGARAKALDDRPIGGQAVLEGVMMRGIRTWSVAVRAPTAEQLAAAVATGSIDLATFGRLSNEQAAMLKREHKALYWDAANALAATAERPYSVVGR